jgi:hypothetical protein
LLIDEYYEKINKMCIDDVTDILNFGDGIKELTYGKEYTQ